MSVEGFFAKWFIVYYSILGFLLTGSGLWLIIKKRRGEAFLLQSIENKKPPRLFISILKYFLLFTLPGLVLSLIHFSWIELLFSLWSLLLVYLAGIRLVQWKQTKIFIEGKKEQLAQLIAQFGAVSLSIGLIIFLFAYLIIQRSF